MVSAKWGKVIGWTLFALGLACIVIGAIGLERLQQHPCYTATLKLTDSSLLSLKAAATCQNNGRPFPITNVVKLFPKPGTASSDDPSNTPKKRMGSTLSWIWGALSIGLALVGVSVGIAYYSKTKRGFAEMAEGIDLSAVGAGLAMDTSIRAGSPLTTGQAEETMTYQANLTASANAGNGAAQEALRSQSGDTDAIRVIIADELGAGPGQAINRRRVTSAAATIVDEVDTTLSHTQASLAAAGSRSDVVGAAEAAARDAALEPVTWWGRVQGVSAGAVRAVGALGDAIDQFGLALNAGFEADEYETARQGEEPFPGE